MSNKQFVPRYVQENIFILGNLRLNSVVTRQREEISEFNSKKILSIVRLLIFL